MDKRSFLKNMGAVGAAAAGLSQESMASSDDSQNADITLEGSVDVDPDSDVAYGPDPTSVGKFRILGDSGSGSIHEVDITDLSKRIGSDVVETIPRGAVEVLQQDNDSDSILFYDRGGGNSNQGLLKSADRDSFNENWRREILGGVKDIETRDGEAFVTDGVNGKTRVYKLDAQGNEVWEDKAIINDEGFGEETAELGGDIFVGTDAGVTALDGGSGSQEWSESVGAILDGGLEASETGHVMARDETSAYVFDPDLDSGGLVAEIPDVGSDGSLGTVSGLASNSDTMYAVEPFGITSFTENGVENRISVDLENVDIDAVDGYVVVGRRSGVDVYSPDLSEKLASLDNENSGIPKNIAPGNIKIHENSDGSDYVTFTGWPEEGSDKSVVYKATVDVNQSLSVEDYSLEYGGSVEDELDLSVAVSGASGGLSYSWSIVESGTGTEVASESGGSSWSVDPDLAVGQEYKAIVEVSDSDETVRRETQFTPAPPRIAGGAVPRDLDGDGRYEDIRGTGEATILDTQALFDALEDGGAQEYPQAFDFSGASPDGEVTILDVAAHWRSHAARE
jgi:hypothetical protein